MKLDVLAFGAHPDDVELSCSGTLLLEQKRGHSVGIVDLTLGELGTRGDVETRRAEAEKSSVILGLSVRINLELPDGFIQADRPSILAVIRILRQFRPDVVLAPALEDRHPDHGRAGNLVTEACFLAGLARIETYWQPGEGPQQPWRPRSLHQYIQDRLLKPDFVVDITSVMDQRMQSILAFGTQFYDPAAEAPNTYISSPEFLEGIYSRAREMGRMAGFAYGEGFTTRKVAGVKSILDLF
ncbi:MAG: bacillithiol biosynthesis deacetylase BshB1 [Bacteroidetes bacterium]|nr:bacillithiol biosynthesis deacetylase BshB1 [Bacteroidota bacterium]